MSSKLQKTIARQQEKVQEGQFYEAHQQLRVIAARYVKATDWASAIDVLDQGATMLMQANQGGSGGDLCMLLMDVYKKAALPVDKPNKSRLITLLRSFPGKEPTRKKFVSDIIQWSHTCGEYPAGDPELHHAIGCMFAQDGEVLEAERHLTLGTIDSVQVFVDLEFDWYNSDEPSTAPQYAARVLLPYILVGNLRAANKAMLLFTSKLSTASGLSFQEVSTTASDLRIYPSMPLLNFLTLLLKAVERGTAEVFRQLKSQYSTQLKELQVWDEALTKIGETYFGIKPPNQGNPLFDMMGSLFGGGGNKQGNTQKSIASPISEAVD